MFEKLSFPVEVMDLPHPLAGQPRPGGTGTPFRAIPGQKAIVRTDTGDVLNIVSDRYQLVPHAEVFGAMHEAITQVGTGIESITELTGSRGGYAQVRWTTDQSLDINGNGNPDQVKLQIIARNSYNYSSVVSLGLGGFRLICSNGLVVGYMITQQSKRHVPSLRVPALVSEIQQMLDERAEVSKAWRSWNAIEYPADHLATWMEQQGSIAARARQEISDYYRAQPDRVRQGLAPRYSAWEAYNSLTWFATHRLRTRSEDRVVLAQDNFQELANRFAATLRN